jgi:uncharacterized membrane protein
MISFVVLATLRPVGRLVGLADTRTTRLVFLVLGLAVLVLVQQTAERGARLVYEQGVGVVTGPSSMDFDALDSVVAEGDSR